MMSDAQVRYDSVFAQASFQFCGHLDEYLIRHTRHLGLLYFQTRFGKGSHLFRIYENGKLVEERKLSFSGSVVSYYLGMWRHWNRELRLFCRDKDCVTAIYTHPLLAVGRSFRRKVHDIFWQWDYFPDGSFVSRLFNAVARRYAPRCDDYRPLTRKIAQAMGHPNAQVMMLGMVPPMQMGDPKSNRILMVGQLRVGQGIEHILDFIANDKDYSLSLMGAAANGFEKVVAARIDAAKMADRVFFPNKFVSDAELREEAAKCFVSLALYDTAPNNLTHYADPGKVKSCIEMGLPVVMTRISEIVSYVVKFKAGEVIDSIADLPVALAKIRRNPESYFAGCKAFSEHFDCEKYYGTKFRRKRYFLTYGDERFFAARERIEREARATGEFDDVYALGSADVGSDVKASALWGQKRGGGYWCWKPDIMLAVLNRLNEGDCLVYVDGGCEVVAGREWRRYWRLLHDHDLIAQRIYQVNRRWVRRSVVEEFSDVSERWLDGCQYMATVVFLKKSEMTLSFVEEWRRYVLDRPDMVRDVTEEERKHEDPAFVENRHDQAVFTALVYRYRERLGFRDRIYTQWEHVENLSPLHSQVIRAMRNNGRMGVSFLRRCREMTMRIAKTVLRRPYYQLVHGGK